MKKLIVILLATVGFFALIGSSPTESREQEAPEAVVEIAQIIEAVPIVTTPTAISPTAENISIETPKPTATTLPTATAQPTPSPTPTELPYTVNSEGVIVVEAVCKVSSYDPALCLVETGEKDPPQWMTDLGYNKDNVNFGTNCHPTKQNSDQWYVKGNQDIRDFYGKWAACPAEIGYVYDEDLGYNQYTGTVLAIENIGSRSCYDAGGDVVIKGTILNSQGEKVPHIVVDLLHDYYSGPPPFWHEDHACTIQMSPEQFALAGNSLGIDN